GGAFVAWLVHTSVDWLHLLPGVTAVALCGAAMLLAPWMRPVAREWLPRRILVTASTAVLVLAGTYSIGRTSEAEHLRLQGSDRLASDPIGALKRANESLGLNNDALPALYLKSAAYARLGLYQDARAP